MEIYLNYSINTDYLNMSHQSLLEKVDLLQYTFYYYYAS